MHAMASDCPRRRIYQETKYQLVITIKNARQVRTPILPYVAGWASSKE